MPPGEGQADSLVATRLCINMTTGNRGLNMAESELDREQNILAIVEGGFWRGREMGGSRDLHGWGGIQHHEHLGPCSFRSGIITGCREGKHKMVSW